MGTHLTFYDKSEDPSIYSILGSDSICQSVSSNCDSKRSQAYSKHTGPSVSPGSLSTDVINVISGAQGSADVVPVCETASETVVSFPTVNATPSAGAVGSQRTISSRWRA